MKNIARHRYAHSAGMRSPGRPIGPGALHGDIWRTEGSITGMPVTARISALRSGKRAGEPRFFTATGLREALLLALGSDDERVNFVCRQVEETGRCELGDSTGQSGYVIEKVLHA